MPLEINISSLIYKDFLSLTTTLMALTRVTNAHGPSPSQQHAGLHRAVWQLQQEVIRPNARFKPTLPKKSRVPIIYRIKQQYYFSGILVFCKTNWPYFEPVNKQGTYETIETISLEKQGRFKLMPREWYDGDKSIRCRSFWKKWPKQSRSSHLHCRHNSHQHCQVTRYS